MMMVWMKQEAAITVPLVKTSGLAASDPEDVANQLGVFQKCGRTTLPAEPPGTRFVPMTSNGFYINTQSAAFKYFSKNKACTEGMKGVSNHYAGLKAAS